MLLVHITQGEHGSRGITAGRTRTNLSTIPNLEVLRNSVDFVRADLVHCVG